MWCIYTLRSITILSALLTRFSPCARNLLSCSTECALVTNTSWKCQPLAESALRQYLTTTRGKQHALGQLSPKQQALTKVAAAVMLVAVLLVVVVAMSQRPCTTVKRSTQLLVLLLLALLLLRMPMAAVVVAVLRARRTRSVRQTRMHKTHSFHYVVQIKTDGVHC
jgi:hypothetical protein